MAVTGETFTQALAGLAAPPQMDRDTPPDTLVATMMFAELMALGARAALFGPQDLPGAAAAVRAAITPLWPRVAPEAARDVLVASASIAYSHGVTAVPDLPGELTGSSGAVTAGGMLDMTAEWAAATPTPAGTRFTPPEAYASSCAFDRDDDAAVLDSVCLLMALAHPARSADHEDHDPDNWPEPCPECGGDDPQGTYGCGCFNPMACDECGDPNGDCECWI
jgi:hypothetical protein